MNAYSIISNGLAKALAIVGGSNNISFELKPSERSENGDYFTNIALKLGAQLHEKPQDIAYRIKDELENLNIAEIEKIEIAGPGFINFYLSKKYLIGAIAHIKNKGEDFGESDDLLGETTLIEFTDPNPFKEFHIGHLYQAVIGEALSRLMESGAANVMRLCYQGDVGLHVAKAIFGMQNFKDEMPPDTASLSERARFMGKSYAYGAKKYEEDSKEAINDLNKKIYTQDPSIIVLYEKGRRWSLEYFDVLYKRLGTKFEKFYFESEMAKIGANLVRDYLRKGVFEESDGAIIFPGEKYDLHNRVFINSIGLPTYEAKDLGLALTKERNHSPDKSIIITASEQSDYFKVVFAAIGQINLQIAAKTTHIANGMVRLPSGKMSSRTGDVITGEWLMDEAIARVSHAYPEMTDTLAEKVGMAAIKYALLKNTIGRDIAFSFDESIALEGASGPYLLYTYVRARSLLEKSKISHSDGVNNFAENELNPEAISILRHLIHFPETVSDSRNKLSPNLLALYLFELSQKFNLFYQKHKIGEDEFRLNLTCAVSQTLSNGLKILGIETVDRM